MMSANNKDRGGWEAADAFLGLVAQKLEEQPRCILPVMPDLLPAVEYIAHHQAEFEADEDIYGRFLEARERIQHLYTKNK